MIHAQGVKTFPRPRGIPENYKVKISKNGAGMKYVHPTNPHLAVRVMSSIKNQRYLQHFLDIIHDISDKEYQMRVWIRGEGPEVQDFDNFVNDFSDVSQAIFDKWKKYEMTKTQQKLLKKFRDEFQEFVDDFDNHDYPEQFIDSPEWDEMIEKAKEVLKAFNYQKPVNSD